MLLKENQWEKNDFFVPTVTGKLKNALISNELAASAIRPLPGGGGNRTNVSLEFPS